MIDIGFEWSRGQAYECVKEDGVEVIRQVGKTEKPTPPFQPLILDGNKPLYVRFAKLDGSAESCLGFVKYFGLLKTPASVGASEPLDDWQREIKKLRSLMSTLDATAEPDHRGGIVRTVNSRRMRMSMTSIDVSLISSPMDDWGRAISQGRPALLLVPKNLLDAMRLQLAKFVAGDGSLQVCKQCGEWFERGASKMRRSIAIFCSEPCKNRFHYLERAKR
jgi:hypothetical protein